MAIAITGDLDWVGDLILYLEALDGGPAADVAGYAFTSSGDIEYSCTVPEPVDPDDRLLGLYRCVAKTAGGVIAGVGYVTVVADSTSLRMRSEEAAVLNTAYLFDDGAGRLAIRANITHYQGTLQGNGDLPAKMDAVYNRIGAPAGDSIAADIAAISDMRSIIAEWIALNIPSDVRGFPATIIGGTDVAIPIEIVDSNNDPITEIFDESVNTVQWLFGMGTSARRARIIGSAEWTSDDLLLITIARADTLSEDDGPRTWMIGCKLTSGELKWVKTGVTRLIGRQFAEPTTTTTGA